MNIKGFIIKTLMIQYKYNRGLNSSKLKNNWLAKNGFENELKEILTMTDFLPETASIGERIYCVMNDITDLQECILCGDPRKYHIFSEGYRTCSKPECYVSLKGIIKDKNGLTANERSALGVTKAAHIIMPNGLTMAQNRTKKANQTLKSRVDLNTGKNHLIIKADWTFDGYGKDKKRRVTNKLKLRALRNLGCQVILVYENEWIPLRKVLLSKSLFKEKDREI